jgi:succinoglycan biosynthesis protein ExoA
VVPGCWRDNYPFLPEIGSVRFIPHSLKQFSMVSIISACRNEAAHIRDFLDSVIAQEVPDGGLEAIVADGLSDDGTASIVAGYAAAYPGRIRLVRNPGRFVSSGLNAAIREAKGEIIVRMDAHTIYAPDYVSTCVRVLLETGAQNVGGPARTRAVHWMQRAIAAAYHSPFSCGGAAFHQTDFQGWVDTVTYGCWHKAELEKLGLFDEELVRNQDDELNLRLIRAGGRIWQTPRIISWYIPRSRLSALFAQYFQYGLWKVAVLRKHHLPARWTHLVPAMFVMLQLLLPLASAALWARAFDEAALRLMALWGAMNGVYILAIVLASLFAAFRHGWLLLPALVLVFPAYHFSYGLGFLWGIVHFAFLRKRSGSGSRFATELTR